MGKLSLLLVVGAVIAGAILLGTTFGHESSAEERVNEHHYHVLARDAATTGMGATVRRLAALLNQNWAANAGQLQQNEVAYDGATYTVQTVSEQCTIMPAADLAAVRAGYTGSELIQVSSTGSVQGDVGPDTRQSHRVVACYLQADYGSVIPPSLQYALISNDEFTMSGNGEVATYLTGMEGNVHTNDKMTLSGNAEIQGHATMVDYQNSSMSGNASAVTFTEGEHVPMVQFNPTTFRTQNGIPNTSGNVTNGTFRYNGSGFSSSSSTPVTIADPDNPSDRGASQPYIWYVRGDLSLSGQARVILPQYTIVVVTGQISISGQASITVTGGSLPNQSNATAMRNWIATQLINNEMPIAIYGGSGGDMNLSGNGIIVGNFYGNRTVNISGNGAKVGSIAAYEKITASGNGTIWYSGISERTVIPGIRLPGKQIVRVAIAEYTDPLLAN